MTKKASIFIAGLIYSQLAMAQLAGLPIGSKYSALSIPDSLKKNADAVMREDVQSFTVKDINSALLEIHEIVTILNEDGSHHLSFGATSSKFSYLDDAEINVYNAVGTKLNTYPKRKCKPHLLAKDWWKMVKQPTSGLLPQATLLLLKKFTVLSSRVY